MELKTLLTIVGATLALVGPLPYIRDIIRGKTKPHAITWFIWVILVGSAFWIQIIGGGGWGSWVLGCTALMNVVIFGFSVKSAKNLITRFDVVILLLATAAFLVWWASNDPLLGAILLTIVLVLGFLPTYKKSITSPGQETISLFAIAAIKQAVGIAALSAYNVLTLLFPIAVLVANMGIVLLLVFRRRAGIIISRRLSTG